MINLMHDLYCMMDEEVHGAEVYTNKALMYKERMPELAKSFDLMAADEMKHANMIESEIKKAIDVERKAGHEITKEMDAIYQFMHDQFNERLIKAKATIMKYKGS